MGNTFNITTLLQSVDQLGQNYVSTAYQALASAATSGGGTGVAGLLLTLYVIFWGIGIWQGTSTGGDREMVPYLARAAVAVGVAAVFMETHQDPGNAPSDGPNMVRLKDVPALLGELVQIDRIAKRRKN